MIRLATKAAAISLPVRGSPASPADARVEEGRGAAAVHDAAVAVDANADGAFERLAASRCTVLRLTTTPMSASALRIALQAYPSALSRAISSSNARAFRLARPGGSLGFSRTRSLLPSAINLVSQDVFARQNPSGSSPVSWGPLGSLVRMLVTSCSDVAQLRVIRRE